MRGLRECGVGLDESGDFEISLSLFNLVCVLRSREMLAWYAEENKVGDGHCSKVYDGFDAVFFLQAFPV